MTHLTTHEMIMMAMEWLPEQSGLTRRDLLIRLRDMTITLLAPDSPPAPAPAVGIVNFTTQEMINMAMAWLPLQEHLTHDQLLTQIRDATNSLLQQLPKWKASMFFKAGNNPWLTNKGVDSSLNWANIDGECSAARRKFMYQSIVANGGDTLLFIAEKLYSNPALQAQLMTEFNVAQQHGIRRIIVSLKNDNHNFPFEFMEDYIEQMANWLEPADDEQVAFLSCLETDEVLSVDQTKQMVGWGKKYASKKRFIVGSQNLGFLQAMANTGAEMWKEIQTDPFDLSQPIAEKYIVDLQTLLPYNQVWAGEFWPSDSGLDEYISARAVEIGCCGVGSWDS